MRKSSRLSVAVLPQSSPSSFSLSTRRVTRQSLASMQTPDQSAAALLYTPAEQIFTPKKTPAKAQKSQPGTPQPTHSNRSPKTTRSPPSIAVTSEVPTCDTPAEVQQAPGTSACLSFTLTPCQTPTCSTVKAGGSVCHSAETSVVEVKYHSWPRSLLLTWSKTSDWLQVKSWDQRQALLIWFQDMPGMDFERYLQPSLRCSLSPAEAVAMETLSPMATPSPVAPDVEMESPNGHSESQAQQETGMISCNRCLSSS